MGREWKPGDFAMIPLSSGDQVGLLTNDGWALQKSGQTDIRGSQFAMMRPLVVIDPEDRDQVTRLYEALCAKVPLIVGNGRPLPTREEIARLWIDGAQAALRSLIAPPKPDEPLGLGATVEDERGEMWVRDKTTTTVAHWKRARGEDGGRRYPYSEVAAVKVLSEGVQ